MILLLTAPVAEQQLQEMLETHGSFVKLAVDIQRGVAAGGGEFHADCEELLLEDGSRREDVWGADWVPEHRQVRYGALINIRPRVNQSIEIQDPQIRQHVEQVVRRLFDFQR